MNDRLAVLRATIKRDEKASERIGGGLLCPILNEQCQNLAEEGRTFDDYFGEQLKSNRARLSTVEREADALTAEVRAARDAERNAARSETTRARLAHERELLAEREAALAAVDAELETHSGRERGAARRVAGGDAGHRRHAHRRARGGDALCGA